MTSERRKRHMIGLSTPEFSKLTLLKAHWEEWTEKETTWGEFLMQVSATAASGVLSQYSGAAAGPMVPKLGFADGQEAVSAPTEIAAQANPQFEPPMA